MNWFIITIIVLVALAPLWHFVPSKRQRRQARLRETAALAGLFVEFRDLPLPAARRERLSPADRQVLYYGCRLKAQRGNERQRVTWWRDGESWHSTPARAPLPAQAAMMPATVLAIDASPASCGIYWREEGDEETVEQLAGILRGWRDELSTA